MKEYYYGDIHGWFDFQSVYRRAVENAVDGAVLVEVGCWCGRSLSFLLVEAANSGKRLNVVGVDHFCGSVEQSLQPRGITHGSVEEECRSNCNRAGYPYQLLKLPSVQAAALFADETLDFVFIDGSHDYPSGRDDLRAWLPKVKWGGTLAGHDYTAAFPGVAHAVHDFIPLAELLIEDQSWTWRKEVLQTGHWLREPKPDADWLLYLPCVNRLDLLANALRSVEKHAERVVVIDQSERGETHRIHSGPIFRWTLLLHFTSTMNWMQRDAARRALTYLLFMHSDAESAANGVEMLLAEAERLFQRGQGDRYGVLFSGYDILCVFNPAAIAATGCWDESFSWYVSDIDYYNRLRWNGWKQQSLPQALHLHHGSQTLAALSSEQQEAVRLNHEWAWRHYRHKWGCNHGEGEDGRLWNCPYNGQWP